MPEIRITVDGRPALTTAQAATRHRRTLQAMRKLCSRHGLTAVDWLDNRTPLYDLEAVDSLVAILPGRGSRPSESAPTKGATDQTLDYA